MVEEAWQEALQESNADAAEVKRIPHKGWAALATFMALITYVSTACTLVYSFIYSIYFLFFLHKLDSGQGLQIFKILLSGELYAVGLFLVFLLACFIASILVFPLVYVNLLKSYYK